MNERFYRHIDVPMAFNVYNSEGMEVALAKIRKTIKEELITQYFDTEGNKPFYHLKYGYFRGHVNENEDGEPFILVDGKIMNMVDFAEFLKPYIGFRIELKMLD